MSAATDRMDCLEYVLAEGILGLRTNSRYVGWSFGHPPRPAEPGALDRCRLVLRFTVDPLREAFADLDGRGHAGGSEDARALEKYHYWRCRPDSPDICYQRGLLGGSKLRLMVRDVLGERVEMLTNRNYLRFVRFRFNNLHSPGYHLTDLTCARLLMLGLCPLHCSAFRVGESTVVVVAPPDTGKTLTTMRAVFDARATYLCEDLAITDGEQLYACPWTSTFRYYDELAMNWRTRWRMRLIRVFPPAELLPPPDQYRTIDAYVPAERIATRGRVTHVAILARRDGGVRALTGDEARRLVFNLNRYEFVYMKSPMLVAYSYFNPALDLHELVERERAILSRLVDSAACLLVQSSDPRRFADLILEKLP